MALAGDHVQVLVGGYELTGDSNRLTVDDRRDLLEKTTFGDAAHNFLLGQVMNRLAHEGFLNADAARSHPVLQGATVDGVVSLLLGQNTDPAVGDPVYSLLAQQEQYQTTPQRGQLVPFRAPHRIHVVDHPGRGRVW